MFRWEAGGDLSINHNTTTFMQITRKTSSKLTDRFICLWKLKWLRHSLNFSNNYWKKKIRLSKPFKRFAHIVKKNMVSYIFLEYIDFFPVSYWQINTIYMIFLILALELILLYQQYIYVMETLIIMTIFSMKGSKDQ